MSTGLTPTGSDTSSAVISAPRAGSTGRVLATRVIATAVAGVLLYASYPPRSWWWLAPVGFAILGLVLRRCRARGGVGYGAVFGLAFFLPHLRWIQDFLGAEFGPAPWLVLSGVMALFIAAACALMTLVARLPGAPVWMALVFLLQETVRARFPLNGFPWGRAAFGQVEGPLLALASIGGAPLVSLAVPLTGFGLAALVIWLRQGGSRRARGWIPPTAAAVLPLAAALALWPAIGTEAQTGTRTVAVVQGNAPNVGLGLLHQRATLRDNHLRASRDLAARVRTGAVPRPDLVVWPETATAITGDDPAIDQAVTDLGAPSLIGALHRLNTGQDENAVIGWDPRTGPGPRYAKQELVPFAEYVPWRPIARWFTPFADTGDLRPGTQPGALDIAGTRLGVAICYEVAYDAILRESVRTGAQLLVVPTNNAWYGRGEMTYQQLAMSRLRAVEHGRAVLVAATSGVSAIIRPDGSVSASLGMFTAGSLTAQLPLRTTTTVADRLGGWTERALTIAGLTGVTAALVVRLRARRRTASLDGVPDRRQPRRR
ncbi:apolipoprotein N-acyltransferase [Amycolatopsis sp. NPDC003865]